MKKKSRTAATNLSLFLIALPGIVYLLINNYAPMLGIFLAFKNYRWFWKIMPSIYREYGDCKWQGLYRKKPPKNQNK